MMNAQLYLQRQATARTSGRQELTDLYHRSALQEGYAELAVWARRLLDPARRPGLVNPNGDILLLLPYVPLLKIESDLAQRERYLACLRRFWLGSQ